MIDRFKSLDQFSKNIILIFMGTSLANFLNLLYQLLIAHKFMPTDFAAFNSLLSVFVLISVPLATLQTAVVKYSAEFNAHAQIKKVQILLSGLLKRSLLFSILTFIVFLPLSFYLMDKLKIYSVSCGYILTTLIALSWITPVLSGGVQGLELFKWLVSSSLITGLLKLIFTFIFIMLGFNIAGALGAFLAANIAGIIILIFPLKNFLSFKATQEDIVYKEIFIYLFPVAISLFCFAGLVNLDMILVKYFFLPADSGLYALAQMAGKIFLFLPTAISTVMFPRTSGLKAKDMDTFSTLKRSLLYVLGLCSLAIIFYNLFPKLVLNVLTGKVYIESILLGRLFGISMSFFTLSYLLISYFLSIKDLRFIKYLVLFTILEFFAIVLFHRSLIQIQIILCINAILLFFIHLILAYKKQEVFPKEAVTT